MDKKNTSTDPRTGVKSNGIWFYHLRRFLYCTALYFVIFTMSFSLILFRFLADTDSLKVSTMWINLGFAAVLALANYLLYTPLPGVLKYCLHYIASFVPFILLYVVAGNRLTEPRTLLFVTILYAPGYAAVMGLRALYRREAMGSSLMRHRARGLVAQARRPRRGLGVAVQAAGDLVCRAAQARRSGRMIGHQGDVVGDSCVSEGWTGAASEGFELGRGTPSGRCISEDSPWTPLVG